MKHETDDFDAIMNALGLAQGGEAFRDGWAASQAMYPPAGPEFLRPAFVRQQCQALGFAQDVSDALVESLAVFDGNEPLRRLAWHCHATLFPPAAAGVGGVGAAEPDIARLGKVVPAWPAEPEQLPAWGERFFGPLLLSGTPWLLAYHSRHGVVSEITRATAGDLPLWMRHFRDRTGRWGTPNFQWLVHHFLGRTYRLGRLQFRFEEFHQPLRPYRHRAGWPVVLLAGDGLRFRADGQFDGAGGVSDPAGAWTATFGDDGEIVRGYPILPTGQARHECVELPATDWRCVLRDGDPVLGLHIPAGEPMAFEACGESFRRAMEFFPRHFPHRPFEAFQCCSWLLSSQLGPLLPAEANIRRLQEEVYLFPLRGAGDEQLFERAFGRKYEDIRQAPRDTVLRRAVVDHILAGGHFHAGGCLLWPQDVDWGRKVYRR